MDRSTPGVPVPRCLLEFTQAHVSWISDTIQPFHPLLPSSPVAFSCFPVGLPLRKPGFVVTVQGLLLHPQPEGGTLPGLSFNTGLTLHWISLLGLERDATVDLLWAPMKNWPGYCDYVGTTVHWGERLSPSFCLSRQNIGRNPIGKPYCITDAREPPRLCYVECSRLASGQHVSNWWD